MVSLIVNVPKSLDSTVVVVITATETAASEVIEVSDENATKEETNNSSNVALPAVAVEGEGVVVTAGANTEEKEEDENEEDRSESSSASSTPAQSPRDIGEAAEEKLPNGEDGNEEGTKDPTTVEANENLDDEVTFSNIDPNAISFSYYCSSLEIKWRDIVDG